MSNISHQDTHMVLVHLSPLEEISLQINTKYWLLRLVESYVHLSPLCGCQLVKAMEKEKKSSTDADSKEMLTDG